MTVERALAQAWTKVQAAPQGDALSGKYLPHMSDKVGETLCNVSVFKALEHIFPMVADLTLRV